MQTSREEKKKEKHSHNRILNDYGQFHMTHGGLKKSNRINRVNRFNRNIQCDAVMHDLYCPLPPSGMIPASSEGRL